MPVARPTMCGAFKSAIALLATLALIAAPLEAMAVTVKIDYSFDSSNFFGSGNPSGATAGAQAKASLENVATMYSNLLTDTLSAIQTPGNFSSSQFNGVAFWNWSLEFSHPATGGDVSLPNEVIPANEYRIYAGARNISSLGIGGPGGYQRGRNSNGGGFTQGELDQIDLITDQFFESVDSRGEVSGFALWGGAITFDSAGTTWNYNHTVAPAAGQNDFYSVAVHELGHALGFGTAAEWNSLVSGGVFTGINAVTAFGSPPPVAAGGSGHWASGTMSRVYGTNTAQEASMDPEITTGTRKFLTELDAAALKDIGWELTLSPPTFNPADFNDSGLVDGADLALWRQAFATTAVGDADGDNDSDGQDFLIWQRNRGATSITAVPEPASAVLATVTLTAAHIARRRRASNAG